MYLIALGDSLYKPFGMKTKKAQFLFLSLSPSLPRYQEVKDDKMPVIHARLFLKLQNGIDDDDRLYLSVK